ncbi:hypothetical protein JTB14_020325 [Gonioctena quinquepunctata]|nr:hypothetical protein JTB14_020325 [Gonioctena quinquepunctata]
MKQRSSRSPMGGKSSKLPVKNNPTRIFPNPFFNFLRHFRKAKKNKLSVISITKIGAQIWRGMSEEEKLPFINLARQASKFTYSRGTRRKNRRGRGRRRYTRSGPSSVRSEETNKSVERRRRKQETNKEQRSEKYDEVQQNSNKRDVEYQGSGPSGCPENRESQ